METIAIVPAQKADIPSLLEMMENFYAIDNYPFYREQTLSNLDGFISTNHYGRIWILREPDSAVMIGYVILAFSYSFEYGGFNAFLDELYIKPAFRNKGLSKVAMQFVIREAKTLGIQTLHLEVEKHNEKARKIYKEWGFTDKDRLLLSKKIE